MKYYFPLHLDGGNRGCEGIAKGTASILDCPSKNLIGLCRDTTLDKRLGVDKYISLVPQQELSFISKVKRKINVSFVNDQYKRGMINTAYEYKDFFSNITDKDIMLSTGGDMMCYGDNIAVFTNDYLHKKGIRTVLWGCSMGQENLTVQKERTLHNFSLIYARESLTFDFFKSLGLHNVVCYPDPAFILKPEKIDLPNIFSQGDVIGLNLSNYVVGDFNLSTPFGKHVVNLIKYILNETIYKILLIPHVTWNHQDDRLLAKNILDRYNKYYGRICVLDIDNLNYCQIRHVISQCKFFVGARTHAVISAYSTCVPTIALGYSIKSRGIAKDLGLSDQLVVNSKSIDANNTLLDSFLFGVENEKMIKMQLQNKIPQYIQEVFNVKEIIKGL